MTAHLSADDVAAELARQTNLDACHRVFARWLGDEYDIGSLDAVLSVAATHNLAGDPPWLLVVSGPGNAKTETVNALQGIGATAVSTITSEGALLSATPQKDRAKGATGGLLRAIGDRGILVIKDVTSIISMSRELRASVLAALREIYDGRWDRSVGTDGARTITWQGRIVLIGAVTTAYDAAHAVISSMGDRFALVRTSSTTGRLTAGRHALNNVGHETQLRAELADAVTQLIAHHFRPELAELDTGEVETLLGVANLVTYARTAVERDYQGNVIDAHAPEMPTRFAKMLGQIARGGLALGMSRERALITAVRVAGDSMPPLRLALLADVLLHPYSRLADVQRRLQKPRNTVDRELQALHLLGLLAINQVEGGGAWMYTLAEAVDEGVLKLLVSRLVDAPALPDRRVTAQSPVSTDVRDIGTGVRDVSTPVLPDPLFSTDVRDFGTGVRVIGTDVLKNDGPEKSVPVFLGLGVETAPEGALYTPHDFSGPLRTVRKNGTPVREDLPGREENPAPVPAAIFQSVPDICPDCAWPRTTRAHVLQCEREPEPEETP